MAHKILCIFLLAAAASAAPETRITGGSQLDVSEAPYVASILYTYPGPGITVQRCVGSLISSWHVLTTGACFSGANLNNMRVQAGSTNSLSGGVISGVTHYIPHPDYRQTPLTADVAVLFVSQPFIITPNVNVLFLPAAGVVPSGADLRVVGWGFETLSGTPQLQNLKSINLNSISQAACQQAHVGNPVSIDQYAFCAAAPGRALCRGDSGVPAITNNNVLMGVGSVGYCNEGEAGVFVSVPSVVSWIMAVAVAPSDEGVPVRTVIV